MSYDNLPDSLKRILPDVEGQKVMLDVVNDRLSKGKSENVAFALAWAALDEAGYKKQDDGTYVKKASGAEPLFLDRPVMNAERIHEWAASQGFETAAPLDEMHVTIIYSKDAFSEELTRAAEQGDKIDWGNVVVRGGHRSVERLGKDGEYVVLRIECPELASENAMYRAMGASTDWPDYKPHITISWNAPDLDVSKIEPFSGDIVLGPRRVSLLNPGGSDDVVEVSLQKYAMSDDTFTMPQEAAARSFDLGFGGKIKQVELNGQSAFAPDSEPCQEKGLLERTISAIISTIMGQAEIHKSAEGTKILKLDDEQRIVWGWAYVSTEKGKLLSDTQGDSIEPSEMEKMANTFMMGSRSGKAMHVGKERGTIIHSLPLTNELMKAFGINSDREGWIIGYKVHDDEAWDMVKSGEFTGFSIGGVAGSVEKY